MNPIDGVTCDERRRTAAAKATRREAGYQVHCEPTSAGAARAASRILAAATATSSPTLAPSCVPASSAEPAPSSIPVRTPWPGTLKRPGLPASSSAESRQLPRAQCAHAAFTKLAPPPRPPLSSPVSAVLPVAILGATWCLSSRGLSIPPTTPVELAQRADNLHSRLSSGPPLGYNADAMFCRGTVAATVCAILPQLTAACTSAMHIFGTAGGQAGQRVLAASQRSSSFSVMPSLPAVPQPSSDGPRRLPRRVLPLGSLGPYARARRRLSSWIRASSSSSLFLSLEEPSLPCASPPWNLSIPLLPNR